MKRVLRTTFAALLIMVLCFSMVPAANAAVTNSKYESLANGDWMPVTVKVTGSEPAAGSKITFIITPVDGSPIPEGYETRQTYALKAGTTTYNLGFPITEMGVFEYLVDVECDYTISQRSFKFTVYSLASGYECEVYCENAAGEKCVPEIEIPLKELIVKKVWHDNRATRPAYIWVDIMVKGTENVDGTLKIDTRKNYGVFTGLDGAYDYEVREHKINDYAASYDYSTTGVVTITNTGSLYQTGQLNWPIPILAAAGMILIAAGYFMLRKKEEKNA